MVKIAFLCVGAIVLASGGPVWAEHAAHAEGEASGSGLFNGTLGDSLWTVVAFVALLLVLTKIAWRPLLTALNARQSHIEHELKSAEDSRQRAEHLFEDYKQQGQTLVRQATDQAQRHLQEVTEKARQEAMAARRRAQEEIESARAAAMEELWRQTGDLVLRVGSEVLGRALSERDNQRLIDEAVAKLRQTGGAR